MWVSVYYISKILVSSLFIDILFGGPFGRGSLVTGRLGHSLRGTPHHDYVVIYPMQTACNFLGLILIYFEEMQEYLPLFADF